MHNEKAQVFLSNLRLELDKIVQDAANPIEALLQLASSAKEQDIRERFYAEVGKIDWQLSIPSCEYRTKLWLKVSDQVLDFVRTNPSTIDKETFTALRRCWYKEAPRCYQCIARLGDAESAQLLFDDATEELGAEADDSVDSEVFLSLVELAKNPVYREQVVEYFANAFEQARELTKDKGYYGLTNDITYSIIGRCIALLNDERLLEPLYRAFVLAADEEQHYGMNQIAGRLALYLTRFNCKFSLEPFDVFLKEYEWRYQGEKFIVETHYFLWYINRDSAGALEYLKDKKNKRNLGIVAALLADLDAKDALPVLEEIYKKLDHPVARECFKEAIVRLKTQTGVPSESERMIWMFGHVTAGEIVLGGGSDNIFALRAEQATGDDHTTLQEADESSPVDL